MHHFREWDMLTLNKQTDREKVKPMDSVCRDKDKAKLSMVQQQGKHHTFEYEEECKWTPPSPRSRMSCILPIPPSYLLDAGRVGEGR